MDSIEDFYCSSLFALLLRDIGLMEGSLPIRHFMSFVRRERGGE